MQRIVSVSVLAAFALLLGAVALAKSPSIQAPSRDQLAASDTSEAHETPAQEKSEEKAEHKVHHRAHKAMKALTDLNSATKEDLMKLPGITDAIADQIIAARPLKSKGELLSKKLVTKSEYRKIRSKVSAK